MVIWIYIALAAGLFCGFVWGQLFAWHEEDKERDRNTK